MKRSIAGILSLLIPVLSWADLTNTAQVSYQDASGVMQSVMSNTVTITVTAPATPPQSGKPPKIDKINVTPVMPVNATIQVVAENASIIQWTMTRQSSVQSKVMAAAFDLAPSGPISTLSTASPTLPLASLSLTPGDYTLVVTAEDSSGVLSLPAQANVTLVSADLSSIHVYPNPWRQDKHNGREVTFDQLTDNVRIKLFTVSGQLVKDIGNAVSSAKWDLTNDSGDRVGSGIYLYLITNNLGQQTRGKLAVIR